MKEKEIDVIIKLVNEKPITATIKNNLETLQSIVGGYIEVVQLTKDIDIICNEEGKLIGLEPNLMFDYDYIAGDIVLCGHNNEGEFTSLTKEQIQIALAELADKGIINIDR